MPKVLVVDDELGIAGLIAVLLEEQGVTVLAAYDGREALDLIRRERVDLVLSDVMMPGLDGRELCRLIKADSSLAGIPVVLMSAAYKLDLRDCGEDGFIPKPFEITMLEQTVARLLPDASRPTCG